MARANKTVRFTQVVERSGKPQVHTLWLPPDKDPELQRAEKAHRVMTVESGVAGGKTDVGRVGFNAGTGNPAQFLIFPKSLKRFEGARVVGIKFDLVAQPEFASTDALRRAANAKPHRNARKAATARISASQAVPPVPASHAPAADPPDTPTADEPQVLPFKPAGREAKQTQVRRRPRIKQTATHSDKALTSPTNAPRRETELIREIRAAMKELQRGKSVAAYQRLERAIANADNERR
jgi:hypothetical protein